MNRLPSIRIGLLSRTHNPAGTRRQTCGRSCGLLRGNVGSTPTRPRIWPRRFKAALLGLRPAHFPRLPARRLTSMKALCGPGDEGEPVITVLLADED